MAVTHAFDDFELDPAERRLSRAGTPVELSARYFDALALMVTEPGRLITKDRFMDEVWRGVPVTDEALTQCVRTLRKALGDNAARPRFIETVPKHGYRFIGNVSAGAIPEWATVTGDVGERLRQTLLLTIAGTIGGGLAGLIGGTFYGFVGASRPLETGIGAISVVLVLMSLCTLVALIGAAGVSAGLALVRARASRTGPLAQILAGAAGGMVVGALAKLLGLDAFRLLIGRSPGDITGALEGAIIGAAVGLGAWLAVQTASRLRAAILTGLSGAAGGLAVALLGRPLMAGSLALLAGQMPGSRLSLEPFAALVGETRFGPLALIVTAMLEGALFAIGLTMAMRLAGRQLDD